MVVILSNLAHNNSVHGHVSDTPAHLVFGKDLNDYLVGLERQNIPELGRILTRDMKYYMRLLAWRPHIPDLAKVSIEPGDIVLTAITPAIPMQHSLMEHETPKWSLPHRCLQVDGQRAEIRPIGYPDIPRWVPLSKWFAWDRLLRRTCSHGRRVIQAATGPSSGGEWVVRPPKFYFTTILDELHFVRAEETRTLFTAPSLKDEQFY